jgi:hypothetical protein
MTITAQQRKSHQVPPGQNLDMPASPIIAALLAPPKRVCRRLPIAKTLEAIRNDDPRPVAQWARLFKTAESTMRNFMKRHRVIPAPRPTAKFAVIVALEWAIKEHRTLTTHEWAEKLNAKPSYIQKIAYEAKLLAAIRPAGQRLTGTLSVSPIRRSDTGEFCGYGKIGISTRMLLVAGLEKENDLAFRIDPVTHQIMIGKVGKVAS